MISSLRIAVLRKSNRCDRPVTRVGYSFYTRTRQPTMREALESPTTRPQAQTTDNAAKPQTTREAQSLPARLLCTSPVARGLQPGCLTATFLFAYILDQALERLGDAANRAA